MGFKIRAFTQPLDSSRGFLLGFFLLFFYQLPVTSACKIPTSLQLLKSGWGHFIEFINDNLQWMLVINSLKD
jgi:hypothetical protein